MKLNKIKKYNQFFKETKNQPIVILQGSKRSGKTNSVIIEKTLEAIKMGSGVYQYFSENPKQQNFGLVADFKNLFNPMLPMFRANNTQKIFQYKNASISFVNVPNNINAGDVVNSMGGADFRMLDEANNFDKDVFDKIRINNRGQIFITYNPYREFWANELITDKNFIKTTWRDNPFLTKNQIDLFLQWTENGKNSEVGSYDYWRWQVMCEGNFSEITGEIFTPENIHFAKEKPKGLHNFVIMADPSNARGNDNFALVLCATDTNDRVWLLDSISRNKIEKVLLAEKIKQWQKDYSVQRTFIETNGEFGLKFYNDCVSAGITVDGWYSRNNKYERIMSNFDVITQKLMILDNPQNREFAQQIYTFKIDCEHDDNIDCLNNAILAYILVFRELKILF